MNTTSEFEKPIEYAVVGGGMLGMTLAMRLAQAGARVSLYESAAQLGGLAEPWRIGDIVWDRHYHVTLLSDTYLRGLLDELGLTSQCRWVETKTGFYTDGKFHSMSSLLEFFKFPPLNLIDKLRLGWTIFYASKIKNWKRLESILVSEWLNRWSGKRTFEKIWRPLLTAKLGSNYEITSAAFIWATIARMYAARRTGLKKEMFGYVRGGYQTIVGAMRQKLDDLGVLVQVNSPITAVEYLAEAGRLRIDGPGGTLGQYDRVVLTTPADAVARCCPQLNTEERARLQGVKYQGIVCASLLSSRALGPYYVTNITDSSVPFTGVIEMSTLVDRRELGSHHLVYLPDYVSADDELAFRRSDEEIKQSFLSALVKMYPDFHPQHVRAFRVSRARRVMPIPTLNYSDRVPPITTSVPGLFIVNSSQIVNNTLNVNEAIRLAEQAAQNELREVTSLNETQGQHHDEAGRQLVAGSG